MIRYEAQLEKDWKYIIENSDAKLIVTANESIYAKVTPYVNTVSRNSLLFPSLCLIVQSDF